MSPVFDFLPSASALCILTYVNQEWVQDESSVFPEFCSTMYLILYWFVEGRPLINLIFLCFLFKNSLSSSNYQSKSAKREWQNCANVNLHDAFRCHVWLRAVWMPTGFLGVVWRGTLWDDSSALKNFSIRHDRKSHSCFLTWFLVLSK